MRVALAVDHPVIDELLILQALLEKDIDATVLYDPRSVTDGHDVIINRLLDRLNRLRLAQYAGVYGLNVFHPYSVEDFCRRKPLVKQVLVQSGVSTAPYVISRHLLRVSDGEVKGILLQEVARTIEDEIGLPVVIKPTEASRGKDILLIKSLDDLKFYKDRIGHPVTPDTPSVLYPNMTSPDGMLIEKYLPHALDLRVLVQKIDDGIKYLGTLARVAEDEERVAKNTALGSIPVGLDDVPEYIKQMAINSVRAMMAGIERVYQPSRSLLIGVDIIPSTEDVEARQEVYSGASRLVDYKRGRIEDAKTELQRILKGRLSSHKRNLLAVSQDEEFLRSVRYFDEVFGEFKSLPAYQSLQKVIQQYLLGATSYVGELNPRVDFGTNTRNLSIPRLHYMIVDTALLSV